MAVRANDIALGDLGADPIKREPVVEQIGDVRQFRVFSSMVEVHADRRECAAAVRARLPLERIDLGEHRCHPLGFRGPDPGAMQLAVLRIPTLALIRPSIFPAGVGVLPWHVGIITRSGV